MATPATLRPRRSHVFPSAVASYPLLWFVNREVGIATATTTRPVAEIHRQAIGSATAAAIVSLLVAIAVVASVRRSSRSFPWWTRPFLGPSNGTLTVFAATSLLFWGIVVFLRRGVASDAGALLFAWPLIVLYVGMTLVGNAVTGEPSFVIQAAVIGTGVALSTVWLFLLSWFVAFVAIPGDSGTHE